MQVCCLCHSAYLKAFLLNSSVKIKQVLPLLGSSLDRVMLTMRWSPAKHLWSDIALQVLQLILLIISCGSQKCLCYSVISPAPLLSAQSEAVLQE